MSGPPPRGATYISGGRVGAKPLGVRLYEQMMAVLNFIIFFFMSMMPGQKLSTHKETLAGGRKKPNIHGVGKGEMNSCGASG